MVNPSGKARKNIPATMLISLSLVSLGFFLNGHIAPAGLLADEGYLWYGSIRTAAGDIPIRDFASYDPGRYLWSAFWFKLLGDSGIISVRLATAALSVFGLTCGLLSLRRVTQSNCMLAVMGVVLWLWMFPQFKAFNHSISLSMVYFAVLLVEKPNVSRHFGVGIFLGLAAFFGRNHGFYGLIAYFLLILFIWYRLSRVDLPKRLVAWAFGIVIGYLPLLIMVIFIPEFLGAFWNDLMFIFDYGATNIPLPVPWPWRIDYAQLPTLDAIKQALTGTLFLVMPVFFIGAGIYLSIAPAVRLQRNPLFVAAAFVGLMYIHYAFSRADIAHLAQGIHPFLLGLISLPPRQLHRYSAQVIMPLLLLTLSLLSVGLAHPYSRYVRAPHDFRILNLGRDNLFVDQATANVVKTVEKINYERVGPGEQLLIAPHWPGMYAILNRKSPLWDTYFLFPASSNAQLEMIKELEQQNTNWVILGDVPLDGRDDLRFKSLYPLVWAHFKRDFRPIEIGLPENYQLLKRNSSRD